MPARVANKDTRAELLVCLGISVEDGRAKGEFVKITQTDESFGVMQDANSNLVVRFRKGSRVYDVEVTLLQSSNASQIFAAAFAADEASTNGVGIGPFLYIDNNGATKYAGLCWIKGTPEYSSGEEEKEVTWMFQLVAEPASALVGGR